MYEKNETDNNKEECINLENENNLLNILKCAASNSKNKIKNQQIEVKKFIDENLKRIFKKLDQQENLDIENCKKNLDNLETFLKKYKLFNQKVKNKFISEFMSYKGKYLSLKDKEIYINKSEENFNSDKNKSLIEKVKKMRAYSEKASKPLLEAVQKIKQIKPKVHLDLSDESVFNKNSSSIYDLEINEVSQDLAYLKNKNGEYLFRLPNSIIQFGFSNDIYYAIGCDSEILFTNSIFELNDKVEMKEDIFPLKEKDKVNTKSQVKIWLHFDDILIFSYHHYLGLYSKKKLVQLGKHDSIEDVCKLDYYENTIVSVDSQNVMKFWDYHLHKMTKIIKVNPTTAFSFYFVCSIKDVIVLAGFNSLQLFSIAYNKYVCKLDLEKKSVIALNKIQSNKQEQYDYIVVILDNTDARIYSIELNYGKFNLKLQSEIKINFNHFDYNLEPPVFNLITTKKNLLIMTYFNKMQICYIKFKRNKNNLTYSPELIFLADGSFNNEIKKVFEIEDSLYIFGNDFFKVNRVIEVNEILYQKNI